MRLLQEQRTIAAAEETELSRTPLAFMSYVNLDDHHDQGRLTQFRERLSGEVRMQTGEPFNIFQDRKDIQWGQQWQERLDTSLAAVTFLLPIITPAFFKSTACRAELERFLKREEELGRKDLILPVYYVNCPVLKDKEKLKHDPLAQVIAARQYADWRPLRFKPFDSEQVGESLAKMAEQIVAALERSEAEVVRTEAARKAEKQPEKESEEAASSANTFQSGGGDQNIAQGNNSIGTQINNYYALQQPERKPKPALRVKAGQPTVTVDQHNQGGYTTITDALKAVEPGTLILVRPGLYKESIVIDKSVEIIGDGPRDKIVIEASDKSVVLFKAAVGRLANLTLRQTGGLVWNAVDITKGRLELEDCDISSQSGVCVAIDGSANPTLRRNRIHDGKASGVGVYKNGQGTLEDNEIFANALFGVMINEGGNPTLRRNRIAKNDLQGILVLDKGGGIFEDNDLRGNATGAWLIDPNSEARVQRSGNIE